MSTKELILFKSVGFEFKCVYQLVLIYIPLRNEICIQCYDMEGNSILDDFILPRT